MELRQKGSSNEVDFLTVLFPSDKGQSTFPIVEATENGVRIGEWLISTKNDPLTVERA